MVHKLRVSFSVGGTWYSLNLLQVLHHHLQLEPPRGVVHTLHPSKQEKEVVVGMGMGLDILLQSGAPPYLSAQCNLNSCTTLKLPLLKHVPADAQLPSAPACTNL